MANTIKLALPEKFDGRSAALSLQLFDIEQYCVLLGILSPTEKVTLSVSRLEKDAHTWQWQFNNRGVDYSWGHLGWQGFKSKLADAFNDVDHELKLHSKLQKLKQQGSVAQYVKEFRRVVLELGD